MDIKIQRYREFLKSGPWDGWRELETDQKKGLPQPPPVKPYPEDAIFIDLIPIEEISLGKMPIIDVIKKRRSRRRYTDESISIEELSYLLWGTQGLNKSIHFRTVPSAGARHPFETYIIAERVEGLKKGLYRYIPTLHKLLFLREDKSFPQKMVDACLGQTFVGDAALTFVWTVIPYRTEWRYSILSHKVIAVDAGHLCQNLYLLAESIGAGTCGVGAYDQEKIDKLLGVDGEDEFTIYIAPLGKISK